MERYRRTQVGHLIIVFLVVALVGCLVGVCAASKDADTPLLATIALWFVTGTLALCLLLFFSLTVVVRGDEIEIQFGLGPIRKTFLLKDVESCECVRNKWYYGWGIRKVRGGWLFNISGLDAVELKMTNGKVYRIGTDDPEGLEKAIQSALREQGK